MNELYGIIEKRLRLNGHVRVYQLKYTGRLGAENKVIFTKCIGHSYTLIACENDPKQISEAA